MKKLFLSTVSLGLALSSLVSPVFASDNGIQNLRTEQQKDYIGIQSISNDSAPFPFLTVGNLVAFAGNELDNPQNPKVKLNEGNIENEETFVDNTWKGSENIKRIVLPRKVDPGCGCGLDAAKFSTNMTYIDDVPIEYTIRDGHLVVFERPGLYYYKQNATQTWLNEYFGKVASFGAEGVGTYASYKVVSKVPYIARLLDKYGKELPYNFGDWTIAAGTYMAQQNIPLWGKIIATPVPSAGTKEVLVYVSKTGKDNTWYYRIRFTVNTDGSLTITKWTVK
jgi:hypothetical protein